jgi:predicted nucleic acid-binding protein
VATEDALVYADASALVKLVIDEAETEALKAHLHDVPRIATSAVALVEVPRATALADPSTVTRARALDLLERCFLVDATQALLRRAEELSSAAVRSLDAIHLASALDVAPAEMVVYDRRLRAAAEDAGLRVTSPGAR